MARLSPEEYHIPVMADECLDLLHIRPDGTYADATLGGGGHSSLILAALGPGGRLFSFDADDVAIERCRQRFHDEPRITLVHANFDAMPDAMATAGRVDGILFDLGVSSYQFDYHARGFSFRLNAPLDMRFGQEGRTAADIMNTASEDELARIFFGYGEDPSSRKLARAAAQRRRLAPFVSTADMRDLVVQHIPPQHQPKTLARIFQALRIAVNDELGRLERTLTSMIPLMAPGGRIVVMSYHSLEDRIVKNVFRDNKDTLRIITRKAIEAGAAEVATNPRARSARLRAAERVA
ncbi:MAG: 16S rRNA (cytosine(1402)-N(4))-methyltransferase RsmH [Candidatus Kapabacteria bacterium]|nr:16S rRNA (cytosine(1402)-N(4))-methyltransferase RsmH [Candidatus Kapabacteria bacterium]